MIELVVFNRVWENVIDWLKPNLIVLVKGKVDSERGDPKVLVDTITTNLTQASSLIGEPPFVEDQPVLHQAWVPDREEQPFAFEPDVANEPPMSEADLREKEIAVGADGDDLIRSDQPSEGTQESRLLESHSPASTIREKGPESPMGVDRAIDQGVGSDVPPGPDVELPVMPSVFAPGRTHKEPADHLIVTVVLKSTGDGRRDALRMRRVHGLLTSYPGHDRFVFNVYEASRRYHLEFPSSTTGYCPELHAQLLALLGEGAVQIEPLRIQ
jgi:hypothetical protein